MGGGGGDGGVGFSWWGVRALRRVSAFLINASNQKVRFSSCPSLRRAHQTVHIHLNVPNPAPPLSNLNGGGVGLH